MTNKSMNTKILAIGLDTAEPLLINKWINEGHLPFLQKLKEQGSYSQINSTANWLSDTPWISFYTGVHPGKHGHYCFLNLERGSNCIKRVGAHHCQYLPFWAQLSDSHKKISILDIPKTYPIPGLNGIQISAWGEEYPLIPFMCLPESLKNPFIKKFGTYQHVAESPHKLALATEKKMYRLLLNNIKKKSQAIQYLLQKSDWDFFMTVFGECHYANHLFLHYYDENHWAYDPKKALKLENALLNIYKALDHELSNIIQKKYKDVCVCVFSVHGVKSNSSGNHLMDLVMEKLGYQVKSTSEITPKFDVRNWSKLTKRLIPNKLRQYINEHFVPTSVHDEMLSWEFNHRINWQKSKAFFMKNTIFQGFISLNLKGREPSGIIEPGDAYIHLCREIRNELKQLVNPETGKLAIQDIAITCEIYPGKNARNLPDIILQWADENGPIRQLRHPKIGLISSSLPHIRKTQHKEHGFIIANGSQIDKSTNPQQINIVDLAPTMLHLLGQKIPEHMKGKIVQL